MRSLVVLLLLATGLFLYLRTGASETAMPLAPDHRVKVPTVETQQNSLGTASIHRLDALPTAEAPPGETNLATASSGPPSAGLDSPPGLRVVGRVFAPVPGPVTLELTAAPAVLGEEGAWFRSYGGSDQSQTLSPGQSFVFPGLKAGRYALIASAKGCGTQTQLFELSQGEQRVDFALEPGFTLAGSLSTDFPAERLGVALTPDPEWLGNVHQGRDGSFRFEDLRAGTYLLRTQAFVPGRRQPFEQEHRIDLDRDILDFQARMSSKRVQLSLSTNLDLQRGFLSGNLTARGPQQQFLQRPFRIFHRSGTGSQAVEVELPPGLWELDLEVAGHHPWSSRVNLLQDQTLPVSLRLLEGRALNVSLEGKVYYVETRKEGTAEWLPLASDRDTTRPRTSPLPTTPWLASGTYDFRISTERGLETILERVVMEPNPEPYILSITLPVGLDVTGTLVSDLPTGSDLPLHLSVHKEGRWRLLPAKESFALRHPARPAYPNCEFFFSGLRPGKYRMCADREGQIVLAEWILRDRDLHPIVEHSFLR